MKFLIFILLCIIATLVQSQTINVDGVEYVKVPNGFGGMKYANVETEAEAVPLFNARTDTRFLVFTRFNPTIGQQINAFDMSTVAATNFSPNRPTRVLIHGWQR